MADFTEKSRSTPSARAEIDREAIELAADFVRAARESAGLSYTQLARRMRAHHFQVRRLESIAHHSKGPTLATLMRVARACNGTLKLTFE
jgi:ribosome-binding protein aMBF1 (putative translation factor)